MAVRGASVDAAPHHNSQPSCPDMDLKMACFRTPDGHDIIIFYRPTTQFPALYTSFQSH